MTKIKSLKRTTKAAMEKFQAQYKLSYDENVQKQPKFSPGDLVFVGKRPTPGRPTDNNPTSTLRPKKHGPYPVIAVQSNTITVDVDEIEEKCR